MRIQAKLSLLTVGLLAAVVLSVAIMVIRSQEQVLRGQSAERLDTLMEGVARIGREALASRDRLMLISYLMVLQKAHPELAFAAVTYKDHTSAVGSDSSGLVYLEREVSSSAAPVRYTVTAYPRPGGPRAEPLAVSSSALTIPVGGRLDVRVEEPGDAERLGIRLGFVRRALDEEVSRALRPLIRKTLGIALFFTAVGMAASLYLSFLLSAPLKALTAATTLASRGRWDAAVPVRTKDEVGVLAQRFNEMLARLRTMSQSREDLLHTLTHELNTPLGGLKAYLELWRDGKLPEEGREEALETMSAAVIRMENSLQSALGLFRSEEGAAPLARETVWLDRVIHETMSLFEPVARSKRILLLGPREGSKASVYAPGEAVRLVVTNLVSNALKYTPEKGKVSAGLLETEAGVTLWVKDTGCGIRGEDIPHLFDKFYRSDEERSAARRIPGTGLGLHIAKKAMASAGGRLWVKSEVGKGSIFYAEFPRPGRRP